MSAPKIIMVGAGGHAKVLIEILRRTGATVDGAVDVKFRQLGPDVDGVPILGDDERLVERSVEDVVLVNAQGNVPKVGDSGLTRRKTIFERYSTQGFRFISVVSRDAIVADSAKLGVGCQVITGAIIHPGTVIGLNTVINTGVRIDHDCQIGAHCHIAPGTVLCGGVVVGNESHVGAGATVIPGVQIGAHAVVGAGAVVTSDVLPGSTVFGPRQRIAG